ncbi:MAG: S-layer homology domain-containing protein [Clostridiales bacterium]|nr:S-layer homology domain-containing protein [Clostridiales bacterium]
MKKGLLRKTVSLLLAVLMMIAMLPAAMAADGVDVDNELFATLDYILETVPAPRFHTDSSRSNEWEILALARSGYKVPEMYYEGYYATIQKELKENGLANLRSTDISRIILALAAIGVDVADVEGHNLFDPLIEPGFLANPGLNEAIYALLAYKAGGYFGSPADLKKLIQSIVDAELSGGGFLLWGADPEPDTTAMVIQVFALYEDIVDEIDNEIISRSIDMLSTMQVSGGGYKSPDSEWDGWVFPGSVCAENNAQVILAATALGKDPTGEEFTFNDEPSSNPVSSLLEFYQPGGGFVYVDSFSGARVVNAMSTQQASHALIAYSRYKNSDNQLYDMDDCSKELQEITDVNRDVLASIIDKAESLSASGYTSLTWKNMNEKLMEAKTVFTDTDATQAEINIAASDLLFEINSLILAGGSGEDSDPFVVYVTLQGLDTNGENEELWLSATVTDLHESATVADVIMQALFSAGYQQTGAKAGYISSVTKPGGNSLAEFTYGPDSGWLYKVNETLIIASVNTVRINNGDSILLYYTKDFKKDRDASQFAGDDFYANEDSNTVSSTVSVSAAVTGNTAVAVVDSAKITDAIKDALDKLKDASDKDAAAEVVVSVTGIAGAASVQAEIKAESLKAIAEANEGNAQLTIESGIVSLTFDAKTLAGLAKGLDSGAAVSFLMETVDVSTLDPDAQQIVGDSPVFNLAITVGDTAIHNFDGTVTVTLPYDPPAGTDPAALTVYWLDASGNPVPMQNAHYDAEHKVFVFTTTHFSLFFIGAAALAVDDAGWVNPFADVRPGDWFYDVVKYVYTNGLMAGTDPALFSPNVALTRGMAVTVLHRLAGSPGERVTAAEGGGQYSDVEEGAYYYDAVNWAASKGVVAGYGGGLFGPEDDITREQMAAILLNYELSTGNIPQDILMDRMFADWYSIDDWAKNAVNRLTIQGLLSGKPGNLFDPKGNATRAEFAAILTRYIERLGK